MTTATSSMTESVARELVQLCRAGRNREAIDQLYSPEIESIEPHDVAGLPARTTGIEATRRKNAKWEESFAVTDHEVDGPYLNGEQFAVRYRFEGTSKQSGESSALQEIAVYTVRDGKIVQERFFEQQSER